MGYKHSNVPSHSAVAMVGVILKKYKLFRKVVDVPFLEMFKASLDEALNNLV